MRSRISVLHCTAAALAVGALVTLSVTTADASATKFRIGTAVSVAKGPVHQPAPNPTTSTPAPSPTSSSTSPAPGGSGSTTGSATDTASPSPAGSGSATDSTTGSATDTASPSPAGSGSTIDSTTGSATDTASPSPGDSTTTASPAGPACGGTVLLKPDGSPWVCTFDDEFDGASLDRSKWFVQTTAASGFHSGAECFVDSPDNVSVGNGVLSLTVRKESAPFTCNSPTTPYTSQYTSGTVNSLNKFSQTYGRFEVRAKLPSTTIKGLQETLWLWPNNPTKYGLWPASGEIDFAEFYSQYAGWNIPYIHYDVQQSTVSWPTNTNVYTALPAPNNQPGMDCSYDRTAFNTYTAIWEPGRITLQVNGKNCIVDNYSATNVSGAAPFDQPFFIALTQALGIGGNAFVDGTTPLPATTAVDYVRVWQ